MTDLKQRWGGVAMQSDPYSYEEIINAQQPNPVHNNHPATWELVIEDMKQRNEIGKKRYNTELQPFNGRNSLVDAYQEALDLCVYLRNAIEEQKK